MENEYRPRGSGSAVRLGSIVSAIMSDILLIYHLWAQWSKEGSWTPAEHSCIECNTFYLYLSSSLFLTSLQFILVYLYHAVWYSSNFWPYLCLCSFILFCAYKKADVVISGLRPGATRRLHISLTISIGLMKRNHGIDDGPVPAHAWSFLELGSAPLAIDHFVWLSNSLPTNVTASTSLPSFKRQLKTFLFTKSFPSL